MPFRDRGKDPLRSANLERCLKWWRDFSDQTGTPIIVADDSREGDAQFNRSAAYNSGSAQTDADILVYVESDTLIPYQQIHTAIEMAASRVGLVVPFTHQKKLTATDSVLVRGELKEPEDCVHDRHPYGETTNYGCANVLNRRTLEAVGRWDEAFCVDEETEIFTIDGWKNYTDVSVGHLVLTLNHSTGLSEWQHVEAMNVFNGAHEMLSIESRTHSSLTTLNHRWPVIRQQNKTLISGERTHYEWREWKTTTTFTTADHIPTAADCADLPTEPKYMDSLVECVAWFWTEGGIHRLRNRPGRGVTISQSHVVNFDNCERIASALTRTFGPPSNFTRRSGPVMRSCGVCDTEFLGGSAAAKYCSDACRPGRKHSQHIADIPRWKIQLDERNHSFILNAEAGDIMQSLAPGRVPTREFLLSLTKAQLLLFIESSMLADGTSRTERPDERNGYLGMRRSHNRSLGQKNSAAAEAFQYAAILAGISTFIVVNPIMPRYGYGMTHVTLKKQRRTKPSNGVSVPVILEGNVWCPTTGNGTWLARRNGKVYFTGNSGHGHDDSAMYHAFNVVAKPVRWVDGNAYHLYHLDFDPDTTPDRSYLSAEDIAAQQRNRCRLELYRAAKTPEEIRLLTSGTPVSEWVEKYWGKLNWRIRALAGPDNKNDPCLGRYQP